MKKQVGILGGAFDPIHVGHMILAAEALFQLSLDKILFVPTYKTAHKHKDISTSFEHRCTMTEAAISAYTEYRMSDVEKGLGDVSYTVDTISKLKEEFADTGFVFLMGADNILQFQSWHKPDELTKLARIAIACRPGYTAPAVGALSDAVLFEIPLVHISATEIRERVRKGIPIRALVPAAVEAYIADKGLYRE